ncbi:MAG: hypothetical protein NC489_16700 [Ruminococcus flavefaciens]|nr:hypothetical protein [Ruminococcus flavefaciens]
MEKIRTVLKIFWFFFKQKGYVYKKLPCSNNKRLVVLCNGPSLGSTVTQAANIENADFLCVNLFPAKNEIFFDIKPRFLCVVDPVFYNDIGPKGEDVKLLVQALEKVNWDIYVLNFWNQKWNIKNKFVKYIHLNHNFYLGKPSKLIYSLYNKNLACVTPKNVAIASIFAGIIMRYELIDVYGIDANAYLGVSVDQNNNMIVMEKQFYGERKYNYSQLYPSVAKGGMELLFKDHMELFKAFRRLREFAEYNKVRIVNRTPNSCVDVFDRS